MVMEKSLHEEFLAHPSQTNNKQYKTDVAFLTADNGIFNFTNRNIKLYSTILFNDDDFRVISIPTGAYDIKSLNSEIKRNHIEEGSFTEANYPFTINPVAQL